MAARAAVTLTPSRRRGAAVRRANMGERIRKIGKERARLAIGCCPMAKENEHELSIG
jgi:hypothetical protein